MKQAVASLAALGLCFAGMTALSLAMDRHHEQLTGRPAASRAGVIAWRSLGSALLAAALWPCIAAWSSGVGLVAWCAWLTAGALLVACTLPYTPRITAGSAFASGLAALALLLFAPA